MSQFPVYKDLDSAQPGKLPVAEKITEQVVCLPIYSDLGNKDSDRIIAVLKS
ncbi:DegT/DnrJ/EryC1/StrS family aminotransferase [Spirochaetota bacterium]